MDDRNTHALFYTCGIFEGREFLLYSVVFPLIRPQIRSSSQHTANAVTTPRTAPNSTSVG